LLAPLAPVPASTDRRRAAVQLAPWREQRSNGMVACDRETL